MKHLKNILTAFFAIVFFVSCSNDDDPANDLPDGGDHRYEISITDGLMEGTTLVGEVPNDQVIGLYVEIPNEELEYFSISMSGESGFVIGGGVTIKEGRSQPLLNTLNGYENSSLIIVFDQGSEKYTFESLSGSFTLTDLIKYPGVNNTGLASYKLNFSGTFRQANYDGFEEDAPLAQINGTIDIKKAIDL